MAAPKELEGVSNTSIATERLASNAAATSTSAPGSGPPEQAQRLQARTAFSESSANVQPSFGSQSNEQRGKPEEFVMGTSEHGSKAAGMPTSGFAGEPGRTAQQGSRLQHSSSSRVEAREPPAHAPPRPATTTSWRAPTAERAAGPATSRFVLGQSSGEHPPGRQQEHASTSGRTSPSAPSSPTRDFHR